MGFRSMFSRSYSPEEGWRAYIIKGGPGTGKSTLMRSVCAAAEEAGVWAERIRCSSDPDSLDAVILPTLRRAIYDGTAPHVMEPTLPGACEQLVDLGQAWDGALLYQRREEIARLSARCSALHRQATSMLACADVFRRRLTEPARQAADLAKIDRAAHRLCERFGLAGSGAGRGRSSLRLACAVTPRGIFTAAQEHIDSYGRVVPVCDRSFAVSGLLLSRLQELLLGKGYDLITCTCSQEPDRIEHLLLPSEDICFTTRSDFHGGERHTAADARAVRTERFLPAELTRGRHPQQAADRREILRFTELAADCMRQAKAVHDRLEDCYRDAMDFSLVDDIARRTAEVILG